LQLLLTLKSRYIRVHKPSVAVQKDARRSYRVGNRPFVKKSDRPFPHPRPSACICGSKVRSPHLLYWIYCIERSSKYKPHLMTHIQYQSAIASPETLENSLTLWVTRVPCSDTAVPAIKTSIGPMGVTCCSN